MRVLIVAKTHMQRLACVGGLALDSDRSVRLMQPGGWPQPGDTCYEVGQIWEIDGAPSQVLRPPHVEDVEVVKSRLVGQEGRMKLFLMERVKPWRGAPNETFENLVRPTYAGHGYINNIMGAPCMSTGYWLPDKPLQRIVDKKVYYSYPSYPRGQGVRLLPYVGYASHVEVVPANTLVRLSLARWWTPQSADVEERCYLQLSGWYL